MLLWSVNTLSLFPFLGFFGRSERHKKESEAHDSLAKHRETQHTHFCCSKAQSRSLALSVSKIKIQLIFEENRNISRKGKRSEDAMIKTCSIQYEGNLTFFRLPDLLFNVGVLWLTLRCSFYTLRSRHPTHHGSITGKDIATDMKWGIRQQ